MGAQEGSWHTHTCILSLAPSSPPTRCSLFSSSFGIFWSFCFCWAYCKENLSGILITVALDEPANRESVPESIWEKSNAPYHHFHQTFICSFDTKNFDFAFRENCLQKYAKMKTKIAKILKSWQTFSRTEQMLTFLVSDMWNEGNIFVKFLFLRKQIFEYFFRIFSRKYSSFKMFFTKICIQQE